jgi:aminopeptidase-like protein
VAAADLTAARFDGDDLVALTRELCAFRTGVVAADNEAFFERLGRELPLTLHRYPSGSTYNGWTVPQRWRVDRALVTRGDEVVLDGRDHPLAVAMQSRSFHGELELDELRRHLVSSPEQPDAFVFHWKWQYRPWQADWALSMPHERVEALRPGRYRVELDTVSEPGELLVATAEHGGESERTIVLDAHMCHPHMANDDMAGVAVLVRLFQRLAKRRTRYSYRLVVAPEHFGPIFYLRDRPAADLERLVAGIFAEMPGTRGELAVASSFLGGQPVDRALALAARHHARGHRLTGWREGVGNDELVWEAPGYEVPFASMSRWPFPEYHTSRDTPGLLVPAQLEEFARVLLHALAVLEGNCVAHRRFDGLVCLSHPDYDLYQEAPDPSIRAEPGPDAERWYALLSSILRYLDGRTTAMEIAERHGLAFADVERYVRRFAEAGLVELEHVPVERLPVVYPERRLELEADRAHELEGLGGHEAGGAAPAARLRA